MTQSNLTFTEGHEIPEGCKNTELGIFPEPWKLMTIQEALDTKYLLDQMDGNHGELYPRSNEFSQSGIAYIGATDFSDNKVDFKNCKFLPLIRAKKFRKGIAKSGDVLFAHNATVGPAALLKTDDEFVILSTTATYYRCNDKHLSNQYLLSFFESNAFKQQYTAVMSQSTRNQVSILAQRKFKLVLPSREEQEKIATALSDTDALISELEKLIEKKQAIKTATMQQLLTGKTRLPEFALREDGTPKTYKESELGQIPEDWEALSFSEVCTFINGRAYGLHEWEKRGTPVIRLQNLTGRGEDYYYSTLNLPAKHYCDYGDLLFMWSATFGPVIWKGQKAIYHYHIWKIVCNENVDKDFLYLTLDDMTENLKRGSSSGGTMLHVTKEIMEATLAIFPPYSEQLKIASVLNGMIQEIEALTEKLTKLKNIKQGMMQELLTGKTRLV